MGLDETTSMGSVLGGLTTRIVPQSLARRAIDVTVETDRERYRPGDTVSATAEFRNRLPVAVAVRLPSQRVWGWSLDGELEASDEARYPGETPRTVRFEGSETKRVRWEWSGLLKRSGDPTRWVEPDAGEHVLAAFLAVDGDDRPEGSTVVRID